MTPKQLEALKYYIDIRTTELMVINNPSNSIESKKAMNHRRQHAEQLLDDALSLRTVSREDAWERNGVSVLNQT